MNISCPNCCSHTIRRNGSIHTGKQKYQGSGKTSYIERFNCTIRQRCARLVRKTLSFSKKITNHIGVIKMFICDYNLKSLPV